MRTGTSGLGSRRLLWGEPGRLESTCQTQRETVVEALACPHCLRLFHASPAVLGKRIRCRSCRQVFGVPPKLVADVRPRARRRPDGETGRVLPVAIESVINGVDVRSCPTCGRAFAMTKRFAGATIRCRACRALYTVGSAKSGGTRHVSSTAGSAARSTAGQAADRGGGAHGRSHEAEHPVAGRSHAAHDVPRDPDPRAEDDAGDILSDNEGGKDVPLAFESSPGFVYDRGGSLLGSAVAIVLGGVMALPTAQLILWWVLEKDPLNVARRVPPALRWSVPETMRRP